MSPTTKIVIGLAAGLALGLLIGGLAGHFATKNNLESPVSTVTQSPQTDSNKPDPDRDAKNLKTILDTVDTQRLEDVLKDLSDKPHLAGSEENDALGEMIRMKWESDYGMKTIVDKYDVLLSYPGNESNRNIAEVLLSNGSTSYTCQRTEEILDPVQNISQSEIVPPFNAYSKAGIVNSTIVYYANYGRVEDFQKLVDKGINVSGSIVICRYGKIFRGNKVKHAEERGAIGVILFNDPSDYVDTKITPANRSGTFPNSWFLPPTGAQRGSVFIGNGDPLTPGYPSKDYAFRKTVEKVREEEIIPSIPSQPMGYEDAEEFMKHLGGAEVDDDWKGGMPIAYKYGGDMENGRSIRITNNNEDVRRNITNVFGIIPGEVEPDRYVLIGNHRDSWMFGATDAGSGTTIMMEVSRVFSELRKSGWKPRRTIVFCSWGGEEYGIIGSIEWVDEVKTLLDARAVTYLNCDSGVVYTQLLKVAASPLMHHMIYEAAKKIPHPEQTETGFATLYDAWLTTGSAGDTKPKIGDLGSGSDHTGFFHRLGITSVDFNYYYDSKKINITGYYPCYHTTYETFLMVKKYVDPTFVYHKAMTQFWAEMTRQFADDVIIPFKTSDYAVRLQKAYTDTKAVIENKINSEDKIYFDYLKRAVDKFKERAAKFDEMAKNVDKSSWYAVRRVNDQLMLLERSFLYPLGILDRKYIRHVIFAPSASNAYGSSAFPGIGDAIFEYEKNGKRSVDYIRVQEELTKAIYAVENGAKFLNEVTELV